MRYLSLAIDQEALALYRQRRDQDSRAARVNLGVNTAVLCESLGLRALALENKSAVERLIKTEPVLVGAWPPMTQERRRIYMSIPLRKLDVQRGKPATRAQQPKSRPASRPGN